VKHDNIGCRAGKVRSATASAAWLVFVVVVGRKLSG